MCHAPGLSGLSELRGGAEGPEWPEAADEMSGQADMEQQHMEHITQETTRRWYARVLSVFIEVLLPSVDPPRVAVWLPPAGWSVARSFSRSTPPLGGLPVSEPGLGADALDLGSGYEPDGCGVNYCA